MRCILIQLNPNLSIRVLKNDNQNVNLMHKNWFFFFLIGSLWRRQAGEESLWWFVTWCWRNPFAIVGTCPWNLRFLGPKIRSLSLYLFVSSLLSRMISELLYLLQVSRQLQLRSSKVSREFLHLLGLRSCVTREMGDRFGSSLFRKLLAVPIMTTLKKSTKWVLSKLSSALLNSLQSSINNCFLWLMLFS